jgi:hypothetical protein
LGIFFSVYTFVNFNYIPLELYVCTFIFNLGVSSVLICHYTFWREKKAPFLYTYVEKRIVLLIVENGLLARVGQKLAWPVIGGALGTSLYLLGSANSIDRNNAKMFHDACELAKSQGTPMPDVSKFQRQGPVASAEVNWKEGTCKVSNRK